MRTLETPNRLRNGIVGIAVLVLAIGVGQGLGTVPMVFAQPRYYAEFADSGGINTGDKVRIAGYDVGEVSSLGIDGDKVVMGFTIGSETIGSESRVGVRTDTILGRKVLEIEPRGAERLRANATLPESQSTTPYQIYDAFADIANTSGGLDLRTVKESLNVLSETVDQTAPNLSAALDGVARFSETIGSRDEDVKKLLANANEVAGVLGNRSRQVNDLLVNAQVLLDAFNQRYSEVDNLLSGVSRFSQQVKGLIDDNPNLNRVLEQLRVVSDTLNARKDDLAGALVALSKFTASLAEALGSGPYFKVMIVNILPYQILQPFVDAAFKKRGIDPEQFWRSAGLPAFQFPDPNGTRQPNGAPPPAPTPLEGTAENPGPAVLKGSPCSYTPPADGIPSPADPLPCADLTVGPFGDNFYGPNYEANRPNVATSPPDAGSTLPGPGIPAAAAPGEVSPDAPGTPVPIAPGPPGARADIGDGGPLGFAPPPPPVPGPPPPPGPGPQVPVPFITPGGDLGAPR